MSDPATSFIPPASFEFLVASLQMQAEMNLDARRHEEEQFEPNLPWARHFIDTLEVLHEKTKGNLTLEQQRMLENALTELRYRYVQAFDREQKKKAAEPAAAAGAPPPEAPSA